MDFFKFIENLKTHEMERKGREKREPQKKKIIAFKATPFIPKGDEIMDDEDEDEFARII